MKAAALALILALGLGQPLSAQDAPPRPIASIRVAAHQPGTGSIPGVIRAEVEVNLGFQTPGRLIARHVDLGDVVEKGDLLALLDSNDLQDEVAAAEAAAEAAAVEVDTAQAAAERTRALFARNVASTADLEQAEQALATAVAADQQARADLVRARDTAAFAEMRAPFAGVISAVLATPGAVVSAGEPVLQLSGQDQLEAVVDLQPSLMARLDLTGTFEIWSENFPESRQHATVSRIEPVADALTRTRRAHLALEDSSGFRLGALIRVRPAVTTPAGVGLPPAAILQVGGRPHVWLVRRQDGRATVSLRPIQIAGSAEARPVTVTSGLAPGDEVVIRGIHSLRDGQAVGRPVNP